ncbi:thiopurine S-methyltransferase [Balneolaceae bacterium YR4-1]|uniref:Thiopurine S-methyltransferase n=1 Tax=Halalkalibaculum roseum TaxID=2709311 RepID=A0A6M1SR79_9BACT|nr:thiopurine S-methyltransferase [Halalkalibaculum roseum]NGP77589.1 thiopurine S-methyltransferase [Halalkalibaculum roseum]
MEISYWKSRWNKGNTGWHMQQVYPNLLAYWPELQLERDATVLVPLCGKSLDLLWLQNQGHRVIGVDVSQNAAEQFFRENGLDYHTSPKASFTVYQGQDISIWCGDFMKLKRSFLPEISAVYDKAALIALTQQQRKLYAKKVIEMCDRDTKILLNTFEYEQEEMNGPPFAVFPEELEELYGKHFTISLLHEESIFEDLVKFHRRGLSSYLIEKVYQLQPKK